jgi:histone deacetylase 1/2
MRNVSRAWAFETGLAAGVELGEGKLKFAPIQCYSHE